MKATEHFKQTIKAYLDERAKNDELFAVSYAKENKNMDDCVTFILNQVKRSKCMGLTDEEVYSLAVHFFDEEDKIRIQGRGCQWAVTAYRTGTCGLGFQTLRRTHGFPYSKRNDYLYGLRSPMAERY